MNHPQHHVRRKRGGPPRLEPAAREPRRHRAAPPHLIQRTRVEYLDPILADFDALSLRPPDEKWDRFLRSLTRRGKARLDIETEIFAGDQRAGHPSGEFVALRAAGLKNQSAKS